MLHKYICDLTAISIRIGVLHGLVREMTDSGKARCCHKHGKRGKKRKDELVDLACF